MTDTETLVRRAAQGDPSAFEALMTAHERQVYGLALRMTGNREDAADLTQEAFLKAWRSLPSFRAESSFSSWLYRLTSNLCIDHLRRQKRHAASSLTLTDEDG